MVTMCTIFILTLIMSVVEMMEIYDGRDCMFSARKSLTPAKPEPEPVPEPEPEPEVKPEPEPKPEPKPEEPPAEKVIRTRYGRIVRPPDRYTDENYR
jgi:hypothetical protein